MRHRVEQRGFTLVELIAVLVIVGVIGITVTQKLLPSSTYQMQGSRDTIVSAFLSAQQLAMNRSNNVQILFCNGCINSNPSIDIRRDSNGDGVFASSESVTVGGTTYPVDLLGNQSLTETNFIFDGRGYPGSEGTVTLQQDGYSVDVQVTATGYAF